MDCRILEKLRPRLPPCFAKNIPNHLSLKLKKKKSKKSFIRFCGSLYLSLHLHLSPQFKPLSSLAKPTAKPSYQFLCCPPIVNSSCMRMILLIYKSNRLSTQNRSMVLEQSPRSSLWFYCDPALATSLTSSWILLALHYSPAILIHIDIIGIQEAEYT